MRIVIKHQSGPRHALGGDGYQPCVCLAGRVCAWDAYWSIGVEGIAPTVPADKDRIALLNRVFVKQTVTATSYEYDSRNRRCRQTVRTEVELFSVRRAQDDHHGAWAKNFGPYCNRSCLLVTLLSADLELVLSTGGTQPGATHGYQSISATTTRTTYHQDGSSDSATETEPGDAAGAATEAIAGVTASYAYSAEVLHCNATGPADVVQEDPTRPPPAIVDTPTGAAGPALRDAYGNWMRRKRLLDGEWTSDDSDGERTGGTMQLVGVAVPGAIGGLESSPDPLELYAPSQRPQALALRPPRMVAAPWVRSPLHIKRPTIIRPVPSEARGAARPWPFIQGSGEGDE